MEIKPIAHIKTDFKEKFGIPRQSGIIEQITGEIIFEKEFRNPDALRGIEEYSYLWLIFDFSKNHREKFLPTVRPPRLGGNERRGVFATRSPFRPNPLGLSCVEIDRIDLFTDEGPVITVKGADLMDGTPIYDIKPYIRYADSRQQALCGYVDSLEERSLKVVFPSELSSRIEDTSVIPSLVETLRLDPRPSYHDDPERVYGLSFARLNVKFRVNGEVLTVVDVQPL